MKKLLLASLLLGMMTPSFAELSINKNLAPAMRGEIIQTVHNAENANLLNTTVAGVPTISASANHVQTIKTVLVPADTTGNTQIDVTLIDDFIDDVSPNARHYPPNFPTRTAEYLTTENVKHLSDWLEPYASAKNASFDVLLRAAKINGMARNLNVGDAYNLRANNHMAKAIKLQPNHPEANFLYGMMISEAGGFKEGQKYLEKAASLGYVEAEQSLAQTDLLSDNAASAKKRLAALKSKHPDNLQIARQADIVDAGGFYIWKIEDRDIFVKPIQ